MQSAASEISACPGCGRTLEETFGSGLGCVFCLLQVGIDDEGEGAQFAANGSTPIPSEGEERFGVYKLERWEDGSLYELGHGAMGVTYRAIDTTLQRSVALKVIKPDIAGRSAEARERFLREARTAAALRHEHIATIFQFGIREESGQYFYAMELIEGETLEERVKRAGPLDVRTTIEIAQQVASALAAAEKRGLIHRDLKPANLMLVSADHAEEVETPGRAILTVKIIDFGLAKALNASDDPMRLTHGSFVGTPAFASPEQFEHAALDVRSDIYSLGATLWFALTGKTPFDGRAVEEIQRAQRSGALPTEQRKAARVPYRLRSLLRSMLAVEPAARPSTHDLAAQLRRCTTEASGIRQARITLAAVFILAAGVSALFIFPSLRTHWPPAGSTSDRSQIVDSIQPTIPSLMPTKIRAAMWAQENDAPAVPQTEEEDVLVPKPVERYSVPEPKTKTGKKASQRKSNVIRQRPTLFKKVVAGFIKLQKQPTKSSRKTLGQSRGAIKKNGAH